MGLIFENPVNGELLFRVTYSLSNLSKISSPLDNFELSILLSSLAKWRSKFYTMNRKTRLLVHCVFLVVLYEKFNFLHQSVGYGTFIDRPVKNMAD